MRLERLNALQLEVTDLDRSLRWYRRMLGLKPAAGSAAAATARLVGTADFCLYLVAGTPQRSRHFRFGLQLASRREVRSWRAHLDNNGATAAPIMERDSYYGFTLADPDGYVLEFATGAGEE